MPKKINFKNLHFEKILKWIKRFVIFVISPFKRLYFWLILLFVVLAICIVVPLIKGVSFLDIPEWYGQKLGFVEELKKPNIKAKPKQIETAKFKKEIQLKHADFIPSDTPAEEIVETVETEVSEPTKYAPWNIKHKFAFNKKKTDNVLPQKKKTNNTSTETEVKQKEDILPTKEKDIQEDTPSVKEEIAEEKLVIKVEQPVETEQVKQKISSKQKEKIPELKYVKRENLSLNYYDTLKHVSGETIIYTANEILVDDTYLYLYGIYTNPNIYDERAARIYLRKLIANKIVDCYIVAETKDGIGTALCFEGDTNINQSLVDAHLADNIAL